MKYVALTGAAYAGKTTLTKALVQKGYMPIIFSDLLKQMAVDALRAVGTLVTVDEIQDEKARYRPFLQHLGVLTGFDEGGIYVIRALEAWRQQGRPAAVFDNVRTDQQAMALMSQGFRIVQLDLERAEQVARAISLGATVRQFELAMMHDVERGINTDLADLRLDATRPVAALVDDIVKFEAAAQAA